MEEKILNELVLMKNEMASMKGELKQEICKVNEKVDNVEKELCKTNENVNVLEDDFKVEISKANKKLDRLIESDRQIKINQTAMLKMHVKMLGEQRSLKNFLEGGCEYCKF